MNINSGILLYVVTVISVVELCVFSPIQSGNRNIEGKENIYTKGSYVAVSDLYYGCSNSRYSGKHNFAVCIFLGIIITSVMQLPCCIKLVIYNGGIFYED